jgi:predicted transcriptional regulator
MKKVGINEMRKLMKMRALGFTQKAIAEELSITTSAVGYHLRKLNERVHSDGLNRVWNDYFGNFVVTHRTYDDGPWGGA